MPSDPSNLPLLHRLLRLPQVEAATGLKKSSIYELMAKGEFPSSIKLTRRAVCWSSTAIEAWIAKRIVDANRA